MSEPSADAGQPVIRLALLDDRTLMRSAIALLLERGDGSEVSDAVGANPAALPMQVVYAGTSCGQAREAQPDVFVVAIDTPGIAGEQMAVDLANEGRRVILFGSPTDHTRLRSAFDAGVLGFVPAASTVSDFQLALADAHAGSLHFTPLVAGIMTSVGKSPELSPREIETLRLYAQGLKLSAVAGRLGISPHTAKEYLDRVREKYEQVGRRARTRTELFIEAQRDGLIGDKGS